MQRSDRVASTGSGAIKDVAHYVLIIVYGSPVMEIKGGPATSILQEILNGVLHIGNL